MGIARRRFVRFLLCIAAAFVVPAATVVGRVVPARHFDAMRRSRYVGPLKRLRRSEVGKPGHWGG
jgi:hypothetical protein